MDRLFMVLLTLSVFCFSTCSFPGSDGPAMQAGMIRFEMTSAHSRDSSSGEMVVYFRPGQAAVFMGAKGASASNHSIFHFDRDSSYSIFKKDGMVSYVVPMKISRMQLQDLSKDFVARSFPETRQILGYSCKRFTVRTVDTMRNNMIIEGWATSKIESRFQVIQGVPIPGFPLELSMRRAASSTEPDMVFSATTIDTAILAEAFIVPAVNAPEPEEPEDETEDEPLEIKPIRIQAAGAWKLTPDSYSHKLNLSNVALEATLKIERFDTVEEDEAWMKLEKNMQESVQAIGESRHIAAPSIEKIEYQGQPALQCTYCFEENTRCRLYRKFVRGTYLCNIILEAPKSTFQQAIRSAQQALKTVQIPPR